MNKKNIPIGQLLLNNGSITQEQLDRALEVQKKIPGKRLGDILIELSYVSERKMLESLAERLKEPFIDLRSYKVNMRAVNALGENFARKYKVIPIDFENNSLVIATNDPLNLYAFDEIKAITGYEVNTVISLLEEIEKALDKYYSDSMVKSAVENINKTFESVNLESDFNMVGDRIEGTPTVMLVNTIISQASLKGASDIHIEPFKNSLIVRIRVDGDLINHATMNIAAHNSIVTRLKILSGMNIAERRVPQDGGFHFEVGNIKVDIRISSLPTIYGEKIVMRLLNIGNRNPFSISEIGLDESRLSKLKKMLKVPNGIILVTGPTGSGKTTTLYAILNELITNSINIITVEDPVERPIDSVNQVQVNNKAGLTFANSLRSILRQDPDVIMIGEIRDSETAEIGVRASITGHLVLASIHTNDSVSTIARLIDMGIEPYMVGAALSGIVSQRLVKVLCPHCKEKYELSINEKLIVDGKINTMFKPVGCEKCNYTGYFGRTGIYELLEIDGRMREMISKSVSVYEMKEYVRSKGVKFLKDGVVKMALMGETSLSEVEKIIFSVD